MSLQDGQHVSAASGKDPATGRFLSRNTAYRTRQTRLIERLKALQASYNASNPSDQALLALAATHLVDAETARSRVNRVRATNAATRILRDIPRKPERAPTLEEVLHGSP
jgi:hypothetical protein